MAGALFTGCVSTSAGLAEELMPESSGFGGAGVALVGVTSRTELAYSSGLLHKAVTYMKRVEWRWVSLTIVGQQTQTAMVSDRVFDLLRV